MVESSITVVGWGVTTTGVITTGPTVRSGVETLNSLSSPDGPGSSKDPVRIVQGQAKIWLSANRKSCCVMPNTGLTVIKGTGKLIQNPPDRFLEETNVPGTRRHRE